MTNLPFYIIKEILINFLNNKSTINKDKLNCILVSNKFKDEICKLINNSTTSPIPISLKLVNYSTENPSNKYTILNVEQVKWVNVNVGEGKEPYQFRCKLYFDFFVMDNQFDSLSILSITFKAYISDYEIEMLKNVQKLLLLKSFTKLILNIEYSFDTISNYSNQFNSLLESNKISIEINYLVIYSEEDEATIDEFENKINQEYIDNGSFKINTQSFGISFFLRKFRGTSCACFSNMESLKLTRLKAYSSYYVEGFIENDYDQSSLKTLELDFDDENTEIKKLLSIFNNAINLETITFNLNLSLDPFYWELLIGSIFVLFSYTPNSFSNLNTIILDGTYSNIEETYITSSDLCNFKNINKTKKSFEFKRSLPNLNSTADHEIYDNYYYFN